MLTLIRNAHVFAPSPLGICDVLVAGGKLAAMGPAIELSGDAVDVVDATGKWLLPGFVDALTHPCGGGGEGGFGNRTGEVSAAEFIAAGVTSPVGALGTDSITRSLEVLFGNIMSLRSAGLAAFMYTGAYRVPAPTLTGDVARDLILIDPVIGVGEVAISDHRSSQPTRDEILRLASEAHVAGLMTGKAGIVHFHLGDGERGLSMIRECLETSEIPPRVFNPTHVNRNKPLFEQACELSGFGCNVDLTAFPAAADEQGWSAEAAVERYIDKGCDSSKLTISSDGGGCLPSFDAQGELLKIGFASCSAMAECLKNLLDSGMSEATVLPLITSNVAALLKLKQKGRIEQGLDADLVVLDQANRIEHVMARGIWHLKGGRQLLSGLFEE
jgi:beta-aspartyl-dipeptidase (metallo-type)